MTFDEQLERAFDTLSDRLRDEVARQVRAVSEELVAATRAEQAIREQSTSIDAMALVQRLADGIRSMDRASTLGGVLDAMLSAAALEAARAGVFLIRGERFHSWRFLGFDAALDASQSIELDGAEAGVIAEAARTGVTVSATCEEAPSLPAFARAQSDRDCIAVPLAMGGQVIAVLYAEEISWSREVLDVLASHAARCLESLTAVQAARTLTEQPALPIPVRDADENSSDAHAAAQRYARLLVAEIKLYHEPQVDAGRRERDLATRLGAQIARARVAYEQRVPAHARHDTDYFDDELIRTLADGDASLLEART
jgi:hypothetical protein